MTRPYADTEYQRNRGVVLAGNPPCALCGQPGADTVDHVIPLMNGGGHGLDNLRPAHRRCNSRAGNRARAANTKARQHVRAETMRDIAIPTANEPNTSTVFYDQTPVTPSQLVSISGANQPGPAAIGRDLPRLETDWSDAAGTLAAGVGGFAETHLGITLMPWQMRFLSGLLAVDANGKFLHRTGLVSTARQQGKTKALAALIGAALTEWPVLRGEPVTVLSTAHRLDAAVELFHQLADILEARFGAKPSRAYGRNEVKMPDGSRWLVKAAGPSAFHGISADLCIADEVWDISADAIDQALVPTMRARRNPLFLMVSTAGTEASRVFQRYREQGLRAIDAGRRGPLYFAEWSPPPHLDPMGLEAWTYANPSLGKLLDLETIQAEAQSPDRAAFMRASVNLWVASDKSWVAPGVWPALQLDGELPDGGVVAIETALDESRYFAVRAVPLADGRTGVTVEFHVDTLAECLEHVQRLGRDVRNRFAITPTIDLHWPRPLDQRRTVVGYGELLKWTTAVKQLIDQRRLAHTGETMLAEHVQRAVAVRVQNAVALSSQRSPGPIELARCLVWAAALAARPASQGKPLVVVANR